MQARGLKPSYLGNCFKLVRVAPHAGAWIETYQHQYNCCYYIVAPHAGAWIETKTTVTFALSGLVAPHAGAWIETLSA